MSLIKNLLLITFVVTSLVQSQLLAENTIRLESLQHWCGAKCLWLLASVEQPDLTFEYVRTLCDPDGNSDGSLNLEQLSGAASKLGLEVSVRQARPNWLGRHLPAIVLLDAFGQDRPGHFVVVTEINDKCVSFVDPALGSTVHTIELNQLQAVWSGYCLVVGSGSLVWTKESLVILLFAGIAAFFAWPLIIRLLREIYVISQSVVSISRL